MWAVMMLIRTFDSITCKSGERQMPDTKRYFSFLNNSFSVSRKHIGKNKILLYVFKSVLFGDDHI